MAAQRVIRASTNWIPVSLIVATWGVHAVLAHWETYFSGQLLNEAGTHYLAQANQLGVASLLEDDAGYLPFTLRIISLIVEILSPEVGVIPYVYGFVALLAPLILVLPFLHSRFRSVIAEDRVRQAIALSVLMLFDWETRQYVNWSTVSGFTLLYISALIVAEKKLSWTLAFCSLLLLASKPVVLPIALLMSVVLARLRSGRGWVQAIAILAWAIFLALYMLMQDARMEQQASRSNFAEAILGTIIYFLKFLGSIPIAPLQPQSPWQLEVLMGLVALTIFFKAAQSWASLDRTFAAFAVFLGLGNAAILVLGRPEIYSLYKLNEVNIWFFRQHMLIWITLIILLVLLIKGLAPALSRQAKTSATAALGVGLVIGALSFPPEVRQLVPPLQQPLAQDIGVNEVVLQPEATNLIQDVLAGEACMAINPFLTPFGRGCTVTYLEPDYQGLNRGQMVEVPEGRRIWAIYIEGSAVSKLRPRISTEAGSLGVVAQFTHNMDSIMRISIPGEAASTLLSFTNPQIQVRNSVGRIAVLYGPQN